MENKTLIKGPGGEDIYREDWTDEWGNVVKDGKVLAACGEWFEITPWRSEEIANAPMDQWFSLDGYIPEKQKKYSTLGNYFINKKGEIKSTIWRKGKGKIWGPKDFTTTSTGTGKYYYMFLGIPVSVIYANVFLKNDDPLIKVLVDHINGDSLNNSRYNLRFVDNSENMKNVDRNSFKKRDSSCYKIYYAKYNLNNEFLGWIDSINISEYKRSKIIKSIRSSKYGRGEAFGFLWERYTSTGKIYVQTYGPIVYDTWKESIDFPGLFANINGCLLVMMEGKDKGLITAGGHSGNYYTFPVKKNNSVSVGRLIYCIQNGISIKSIIGLEIDHGKGFSNHLSNLSLGTHEDNMNNPETLKKKYVKICKIDLRTFKILKIYNSIKEAAEEEEISYISIFDSLTIPSRTAGMYLWSYEGKEEERIKEYKETAVQLPRKYWEIKENRLLAVKECIYGLREYKIRFHSAYKVSEKIPNELKEFFPEYTKPNTASNLSKTYWKDKENRKSAAANCRDYFDYIILYSAAWKRSRKIPGELEEFFPEFYEKKNRKE